MPRMEHVPDVAQSVKAWLQLSRVHVFIWPQLGNLIFLDLNGLGSEWDSLVKLQPRAIVETSPGNFQAWLTMSHNLAPKTAKWVQDQLVRTHHPNRGGCLVRSIASLVKTIVWPCFTVMCPRNLFTLLLRSYSLRSQEPQCYTNDITRTRMFTSEVYRHHMVAKTCHANCTFCRSLCSNPRRKPALPAF